MERSAKMKDLTPHIILIFNKRTFGQQIANSEKNEFLKSLSKKCEEWQINQADYSIKLYNGSDNPPKTLVKI